jgi:hypothetical protein
LANTRGGLLVFGVSDDIQLKGVDPTAVNAQTYAQWLRNHVRPFLPDVGYTVLTSTDGAMSVLVVDIPASESAPHSVTGTAARDKEQNAFVVPYRDHSHTAWMEEHQIARAYRDRFTSQERHDQALTRTWDSVRDLVVIPDSDDAWAIFVAQPIRPVPQLARVVTRDDVTEALRHALAAAILLRTSAENGVQVLDNLVRQHTVRVGLRSWVVSNAVTVADADKRRGVYAQVGIDGSVALAVNTTTKTYGDVPPPDGIHIVNAVAVDVAAGEFVGLAQALNRLLHHDSPLAVLAGVTTRDTSGLPFACAIRNEIGSFYIPHSSRTPRRVQSWTTEILVNESVDGSRTFANTLSSSLLNQFGVDSCLYKRAE